MRTGRSRCMDFARVQEKDGARTQSMGCATEPKAHYPRLDHPDGGNRMKMRSKLVFPIGAVKQLGAFQGMMPPDASTFLRSRRHFCWMSMDLWTGTSQNLRTPLDSDARRDTY